MMEFNAINVGVVTFLCGVIGVGSVMIIKGLKKPTLGEGSNQK